MTASLNHLERVAIARLHALLELLPTALDQRLRPAGITGFEYTLLEALSEAADGRMRMSALAAKTNATAPRISRVANSLERRGLAARTPCAEDARATNLQLTPLGAETYDRSQELYGSAVRELVLDGLRLLPGDGAAQLAELSYAILSSLDPAASSVVLREDGASSVVLRERSESQDPALATCAADPVAADPERQPAGAQRIAGSCAADPVVDCAADPVVADTDRHPARV